MGNAVKSRQAIATVMLMAGMGLLPLRAAQAGTVLYDSANFIQGQESFTQSFDVASAGTLTVTLSDVPWLDTLQGLTFFVTSGAGVVGSSMGVGTESLSLTAGTYFAHWFGDADGQYQLGVADLKIEFTPATPATVPLPGSLGLLLGGLGLLFGWRHKGSAA